MMENTNLQNSTVPGITVVISTCNRGSNIVDTIRSILNNDYPNYELRIIDQSDNDLTKDALLQFADNNNIIYMKSNTKGCSTGRNIAISNSKNELIAITDDDCEVPNNWLQEMVNAFNADPRIGAVYGNVLAGNYNQELGFIPTYIRSSPFLANDIRQKNKLRGMSACMGLKRSVWELIHGFDQMLGTGAILKGASENDFAIKVLLHKKFVYETPKFYVIHNGFRTWKEGRAIMYRYNFGTGAMLAKYLKQKLKFIIPIILFEYKCVIVAFLYNIFIKGEIRGITPIVALSKGILVGLSKHVEKTTGNYVISKL